MPECKYPEIEVELVGHNGNALAIMGRVQKELRRNDVPREEIDKFQKEALSGDYDHLLRTAMRWVNVV